MQRATRTDTLVGTYGVVGEQIAVRGIECQPKQGAALDINAGETTGGLASIRADLQS